MKREWRKHLEEIESVLQGEYSGTVFAATTQAHLDAVRAEVSGIEAALEALQKRGVHVSP